MIPCCPNHPPQNAARLFPHQLRLSLGVWLLLGVIHRANAAVLSCTSGTTYASTFSAGGVATTSVTDSTGLNTALATLSSTNPTGAILSLATGTYALDQAYDLVGNVCIQSTGPATATITAYDSSRHFTKSAGILQLVGLTVAGGTQGFTHGGVAVSNSGTQAAFEDLDFTGNADFGNGGALVVSGGAVYVGDGVVFDANAANDGGHLYISGGTVTMGRHVVTGFLVTGNGESERIIILMTESILTSTTILFP